MSTNPRPAIFLRCRPRRALRCPDCGEPTKVFRNVDTNVHHLGHHRLPASPFVGEDGACTMSGAAVGFVPESYASVALIWNSDRTKLLAVSRKTDPNDLGLPGGKGEAGEDPLDAVVREVEEETGLEITEASYVYRRLDYANREEVEPSLMAFCFLVTSYEGEPRQVEAGHVVWVDPARLLEEPCSFKEYNRAVLTALGIVKEPVISG